MSPEDLKYTAEHEWVRPSADAGVVRIGITDYAQGSLGDIVFVTLPDLGAELVAGTTCGEVESTKSVSDIYAPLAGKVVALNDELTGRPELVNTDPYGSGWMFEIALADPAALDGLLDSAAYEATID